MHSVFAPSWILASTNGIVVIANNGLYFSMLQSLNYFGVHTDHVHITRSCFEFGNQFCSSAFK